MELVALGPGPQFGSETFWVDRAMLDALIRLDTPLPSPILASIAQAFPKEATILLLRDPPSHLELLTVIRKRRSGLESIAAGNALSRLHAPGFAASILTELALRHRFLVSDNGQPPGGGYGSSIGSGWPTLRVPPDFPAIGLYELDAVKWPGGELVSDGPTPICSHRTVWEPGVEKPVLSGGVALCLPCEDITYLAQMAGVPSDRVESAAYGSTAVRWTDRAQVSAEISRAIADRSPVPFLFLIKGRIPIRYQHDGVMVFSPDGKTIYDAGPDFAAYDVEALREHRRWKGTGGRVRSLAISTDGHVLLSGGDDGFIRLWHDGPLFALDPR